MMAMATGHAQITIPTVTVGDEGNANDTTGYGGVSYIYNIAVTEVLPTPPLKLRNAITLALIEHYWTHRIVGATINN